MRRRRIMTCFVSSFHPSPPCFLPSTTAALSAPLQEQPHVFCSRFTSSAAGDTRLSYFQATPPPQQANLRDSGQQLQFCGLGLQQVVSELNDPRQHRYAYDDYPKRLVMTSSGLDPNSEGRYLHSCTNLELKLAEFQSWKISTVTRQREDASQQLRSTAHAGSVLNSLLEASTTEVVTSTGYPIDWFTNFWLDQMRFQQQFHEKQMQLQNEMREIMAELREGIQNLNSSSTKLHEKSPQHMSMIEQQSDLTLAITECEFHAQIKESIEYPQIILDPQATEFASKGMWENSHCYENLGEANLLPVEEEREEKALAQSMLREDTMLMILLSSTLLKRNIKDDIPSRGAGLQVINIPRLEQELLLHLNSEFASLFGLPITCSVKLLNKINIGCIDKLLKYLNFDYGIVGALAWICEIPPQPPPNPPRHAKVDYTDSVVDALGLQVVHSYGQFLGNGMVRIKAAVMRHLHTHMTTSITDILFASFLMEFVKLQLHQCLCDILLSSSQLVQPLLSSIEVANFLHFKSTTLYINWHKSISGKQHVIDFPSLFSLQDTCMINSLHESSLTVQKKFLFGWINEIPPEPPPVNVIWRMWKKISFHCSDIIE